MSTARKWRAGYGYRTLLRLNGQWFTFKSEHPLEERIVRLTADYLDEAGDFIPPEPVAWDGVVTGDEVVPQ